MNPRQIKGLHTMSLMTIKELAAKVDVTRLTWISWEKGRHVPKAPKVRALWSLADELGLSDKLRAIRAAKDPTDEAAGVFASKVARHLAARKRA